jgi:hypothetical protein
MLVDLEWRAGAATKVTLAVGRRARSRPVRVVYRGELVSAFTTRGGGSTTIWF